MAFSLHFMPVPRLLFARHRRTLLVLCLIAVTVRSAWAADTTAGAPAPAPSVTVTLINRLVERGALNKQDAAELLLLAEADAAEARAQTAMVQSALAQAAAAEARSKALAA